MEVQTTYPTAPASMQHHIDTASPRAHAGREEHVENPGKAEGVMSKMKRKAKNLKNKIKKATGSDHTTSTDHGNMNNREHEDVLHQHAPGTEDEEVDDESFEDDEQKDEHIDPADYQLKFHELRSIGALDNQGDGSEVEVHGGVPVSALAFTSGTYWKGADDNAPIIPYKTGGPPDTLQATPTAYNDYAPLLQLGGEGKTTTGTPNDVVQTVEDNDFKGRNQEPDSLGLPTFGESKMVRSPPESHSTLGNSAMPDSNVAYPEDLVKPNPQFGHSSSPARDKVGVTNEDLSTDRKLRSRGHTAEDDSGRGKENLLETSVPEFAELSGSKSSASVPIDADELVYRPVSDLEEGSSLTSPPGTLDGVVYEPNVIAQTAGTGQSIDNTTNAFANDPEFANTRGDEKPIFNVADGVNNLSLEQSPYREAAEPEKKQQESSDNVKDEGTSLTCPPRRSGGPGGVYEPNAIDQTAGTVQSIDNSTSAFLNDPEYPSTHGDEKSIFDTADGVEKLSLEHSTRDETGEPETNQQESWGKLSEDKRNDGMDVVPSGLADNMSKSEPQQTSTDGRSNNGVDAVAMEVGGSDKATNFQGNNELLNARALGDGSKGIEEQEYYDPNTVKDNQFQEGFSLGSGEAEEDALNSTLAGSVIGKFQGLKDTVTSTLGYGNVPSSHTEDGGDGEVRADIGREDAAPSPRLLQQPGFIGGLKDGTIPSSFGYGKEATDEVSHRDKDEQSPIAEREQIPKPDIDGSQQQTGGVLQGLKNTVASKFGYNGSEKLHPVETGHMTHDEEPLISPTTAEETAGDNHQPESYMQMLFHATAAAGGYLSSKVGYGNSNQEKADRDLAYAGEEENPNPSDHAANEIVEDDAKGSTESMLSPNEDDKALSQAITDKLSGAATMIGERPRHSGGNLSSSVLDSQSQHNDASQT